MMTLNLALRNLLRNRRRSLATVLAMAIGSASILLFGGFSTNVNYELHARHVQKGGTCKFSTGTFTFTAAATQLPTA